MSKISQIPKGYQGVSLTFLMISPHFYWPNYHTTVKNYVLSCGTCQHFGSRPSPVPLNPPAVPTGIMQVIMIDYMSMPLTPSGNCCILVGIYLLTHWVHLQAFPTEDVDNALVFLFDWIYHYGLPDKIISDRGPHFDNSVMSEFWGRYGLNLTIGTPYHPHRTGQVERTVRIVRNVIEKMAHHSGLHWDTHLNAVAYVLRISPTLPHGASPFYLLYGR
jgi:Integrase zinc binding domain